MQLHDLKPNEGAKKGRKRVGRGTGSGMGKSAGRGTKGQSARTSGGVRLTTRVVTCPSTANCPSAVKALRLSIACAMPR